MMKKRCGLFWVIYLSGLICFSILAIHIIEKETLQYIAGFSFGIVWVVVSNVIAMAHKKIEEATEQ